MVRNCYLYSLLILALWSCKKPEDRTCWKKRGADAESIIVFNESFNTIEVNDRLALKLIQDTTIAPYLKISGGANLIQHVDYSIAGNKLTFKDENKCGFIRRKKDPIQLEVNVHDLQEILMNNGADVFNEDTLYLNALKVVTEKYATGDLHLCVKSGQLQYQNYQEESVVNVNLRGRIQNLNIEHNGYGKLDTRSGQFNFIGAYHFGVNSIYLKAVQQIDAHVRSRGDIYIEGNAQVNTFLEGSGNIILP